MWTFVHSMLHRNGQDIQDHRMDIYGYLGSASECDATNGEARSCVPVKNSYVLISGRTWSTCSIEDVCLPAETHVSDVHDVDVCSGVGPERLVTGLVAQTEVLGVQPVTSPVPAV